MNKACTNMITGSRQRDAWVTLERASVRVMNHTIRISGFGFRSDFGFRVSDLFLRIPRFALRT
jgi:hypothetical protein